MNKTLKKGMLLTLVIMFTITVVGCDEAFESREIDEDRVMEPTYNEEMEPIYEMVREIEMEDFTLITRYNTIDYDISKWRIVDNKTIKMEVWTDGAPNDWEIIVEHAHIDMFITPDEKRRPVLLQDQMDDKFHGVGQDGFKISDDTKYENIFSVIGVDQKLADAINPYDSMRYPQYEVREKHLLNKGYNTSTMQIVYDVMIKKPNEEYFTTHAVYDIVHIPVGGTIE